jgi:hypothetical protein
LRQQRLLLGLRSFRDQRTAMAVGCCGKTRSHIISEERNFGDVGSLLDRQDAAFVAAVLRVPERRVDAEGDARQVDAFLRAEVRHLPVKVEGLSSHSVPVGPAKVTSPESVTLTSSTVSAEIVAGALPVFCSTTNGSVIAENRDGRGMAPVRRRQRAAGIGAVSGIGECRLRAEGDVQSRTAFWARPGD